MSDWRTSIRSSKAIVLGSTVCCDGFFIDAQVRVQSHVHTDHTASFESSIGVQDVYALRGTRDLLIADRNATLDVRSNFKGVNTGDHIEVPGGTLELVDSGHMLGSAQAVFTHDDGYRTGYSGDFSWPIDQVIEVDELVIDSTYGNPSSVRKYSQADAEEALCERVAREVCKGAVFVRAYQGSLQRAFAVVSETCEFPLIASERQCKEIQVYRAHGYSIGPVLVSGSSEAEAARAEGRFVMFEGKGDAQPTNRTGYSIKLSAMFAGVEEPVLDYHDRACAIAISNHADFEGTIAYVERSGATRVLTDNVRGPHGVDLALAIRQRFSHIEVDAAMPDPGDSKGWGQ